MGPKEHQGRDRYHPDENRDLSTAILEAIEEQKGMDVARSDFQLYNDIDPDALDRLFREDASANTTVQFDTDDVTVTLWGDGGVEIDISPRDPES